jgi:predicted PurR-regulated permease PerM
VTLRVVAQLLLGIFVVFFLLYDGGRIWWWLTDRVPIRARSRVRAAGEAAWVTLCGYVHGALIIALIHAVVIGTALFLLDVPIFLPLALLVFIGSFIPLAGALVAGGLAVLITLGTRGLIAALILLAVLLLENELEAHVLQPFVVGRYVRLHPLAIVLVLAVGTWLGGIVGALTAVPVAGVAANAWRPLRGRPAIVTQQQQRRTWMVRVARRVRRTAAALVRRIGRSDRPARPASR